MEGESPKEAINGNMLENFNLMQFRCIRCGSNELTKSTPTFLQKVVEDNSMICGEIFQVNDINQQLALYVISCLTCKKCNNRISVTVLDHVKMKK
jgi:hypothetical protein